MDHAVVDVYSNNYLQNLIIITVIDSIAALALTEATEDCKVRAKVHHCCKEFNSVIS